MRRPLPLLALGFLACTADFGSPDPSGSLGSTGWKEDGYTQSSDALEIALRCDVQCAFDDAPRTVTVDTAFDPAVVGLRRGNGNYYGSLGEKLWSFGGATCAYAAETECGSEAAIALTSLARIDSGEWSMPRKATCEPDVVPAFVLSPFDPDAGVRHALTDTTIADQRTLTEVSGAVIRENDGSLCAWPLSATVCGGDCLVDLSTELGSSLSGHHQTLFSASPNFSQRDTVCADAFVEVFGGRSLAPSLLELECERYFWNSLRGGGDFDLAASRAATRATIACGDLIAQMP